MTWLSQLAERGASGGRTGVTLLELIVVIAILGLLAGVVGLAAGRAEWTIAESEQGTATAEIAAARRRAITSGRSRTVSVEFEGAERFVTALPDGRVLGPAALGIDLLSGERTARADSLE